MERADYDQALAAAQRWIAEHGRYPQQQEWEHWAAGRPTTRTIKRTIKRRWGWEELMVAAGGAGAGRGLKAAALKAHRLELQCALRWAREELGRWPTASEWEAATSEHASRRSYVRAFGSWTAACRTAARLKL